MIPADGIGKEVIPAAEKVLNAVGKFKFISLDAGFEHFKATGVALPDETVAALKEKCSNFSLFLKFLPTLHSSLLWKITSFP